MQKKIKQGDTKALEKLVTANLRFVVSVAKKYQGQGLELADLINEGNIGLIDAAREFDETRRVKFISFAVWHIRKTILKALNRKSRLVRIPENTLAQYAKIKRQVELFEQKHCRSPVPAELSEELPKGSEQRMVEYDGSLEKPISIEAVLSLEENLENNSSDIFHEAILHTEDPEVECGETLESFLRSLTNMKGTERSVLLEYFGFNKDREEKTAEQVIYNLDLSIGAEGVRVRKEKALKYLQKYVPKNILEEHR